MSTVAGSLCIAGLGLCHLRLQGSGSGKSHCCWWSLRPRGHLGNEVHFSSITTRTGILTHRVKWAGHSELPNGLIFVCVCESEWERKCTVHTHPNMDGCQSSVFLRADETGAVMMIYFWKLKHAQPFREWILMQHSIIQAIITDTTQIEESVAYINLSIFICALVVCFLWNYD